MLTAIAWTNTLLLLSGVLSVTLAGRAARYGDVRQMLNWLITAVALMLLAVFLGAFAWSVLYKAGGLNE